MAGKMKVTILSLDDAIASSVAGPADIFGQVGIAWNDMQGLNRDPRFEVEVVTADGRPSVLSSNVLIQPHGSLQSVQKTDIIVISSGITDDFQSFHNHLCFSKRSWRWADSFGPKLPGRKLSAAD